MTFHVAHQITLPFPIFHHLYHKDTLSYVYINTCIPSPFTLKIIHLFFPLNTDAITAMP
ncbi:hypothetical protein Syun_007272 [Stephania yunnanensis]|uniref:Uncharacterized protein n=1 Tax=Stephania yunnanensis TaxID=152371 RepID=A0AAP0Q284_9MAGN